MQFSLVPPHKGLQRTVMLSSSLQIPGLTASPNSVASNYSYFEIQAAERNRKRCKGSRKGYIKVAGKVIVFYREGEDK